jgi:hypothetical protein
MSNQRITLFNGSIATQSHMSSEPDLIKVSSMINSAILFLLEIIFFYLYFCIQFHIEIWFHLIKQDNLSDDVLLKDNPEKYKYNPYAIYSEGVLFFVLVKRDRTSSSYRFFG